MFDKKLSLSLILSTLLIGSASAKTSPLLHVFDRFDDFSLNQAPCLPSPNTHLLDDDGEGFAAKTCTNEEYGMPGWTRENGNRFHKGVDIVPIEYETSSKTVQIDYYDHRTGKSFSRKEPVLIPKDEIYSVLDGQIVVANALEKRSGYGCYVMVLHQWSDGTPFISMYAHMNRLCVSEGQSVHRGERIGWMGQTSSNGGGRRYLMAIPHCHFEVGHVILNDFPKTMAARMLSPPMLGGKFDPRNIQPFNPVLFLKAFHAKPHDTRLTRKD